MANKTFVEKAAEKVGYGLAMAEDLAGTVKTAIGSAADALKDLPSKEPKQAVKKAAGTPPTRKAAKKSPAKKPAAKRSPAKKSSARKSSTKKSSAKKSPAKKAVSKKAAKKPAKKAARSRR
ncbi:MAG TPA: hypothetical protein VKT75_11860 [Acidobacteriaceae bacterium]|nr:hypothetical protein [Acidobacteriaceae bacterium]